MTGDARLRKKAMKTKFQTGGFSSFGTAIHMPTSLTEKSTRSGQVHVQALGSASEQIAMDTQSGHLELWPRTWVIKSTWRGGGGCCVDG